MGSHGLLRFPVTAIDAAPDTATATATEAAAATKMIYEPILFVMRENNLARRRASRGQK